MPSDLARSPSGPTRLGPATAPNVVETIAIETAVARLCGGARSVPAYRACRLVAVPAPYTNRERKNSGALSSTAASTIPAAPTPHR